MAGPVITAVARYSAPPAGMATLAEAPASTAAIAVTAHASAIPAAIPAMACAAARRRVVCPASSSSVRPASSSPRVSRAAASIAQTAPTGTSTPMARHAVNPATVDSRCPSPSRAVRPAFAPKVSATCSRDPAVG